MKRRMIGQVAYNWIVFVENYELLLNKFQGWIYHLISYAIKISKNVKIPKIF